MLYLIGLGLGDPKDITVKGLEAVRQSAHVYLECYTSVLPGGVEALQEFYGRQDLQVADRDFVEQQSDAMLEQARQETVSFLVVGDPLGATTHTDLILRAKERGVEYRVIHNASIMNAIASTGLQLYRFGETVSIPFWTETWKPSSWFDKILKNYKQGLHTLCLLDIKVKEPNLEAMVRGRIEYDPPRFMTVDVAAQQIMEVITGQAEADHVIKPESPCIGVARIGSDSQQMIELPLQEMSSADLGEPLHSLVIPAAELHPLESEFEGLMNLEDVAHEVLRLLPLRDLTNLAESSSKLSNQIQYFPFDKSSLLISFTNNRGNYSERIARTTLKNVFLLPHARRVTFHIPAPCKFSGRVAEYYGAVIVCMQNVREAIVTCDLESWCLPYDRDQPKAVADMMERLANSWTKLEALHFADPLPLSVLRQFLSQVSSLKTISMEFNSCLSPGYYRALDSLASPKALTRLTFIGGLLDPADLYNWILSTPVTGLTSFVLHICNGIWFTEVQMHHLQGAIEEKWPAADITFTYSA